MGSAIWLIYFGDVSENLAALLGIFGGIGIMGALIWFVINMIEDANRPVPRWLLIACPIAIITAVLLPSKNVFYAEAALVAGDAALHTQTGDKAIRALNAWLDSHVADDGAKGK